MRIADGPARPDDAVTRGYLESGLQPGLLRFRTALTRALVGTNLCRIAVMGESIEMGYPGSMAGLSWPNRLRNLLCSQLSIPDAGEGWVPVTNNTGPAYDPRWTFPTAGFSSPAYPDGTANGSSIALPVVAASTSGAQVRFTSREPGTVATVLLLDMTSGANITVSIDGGTAVAVTNSGNTSGGWKTYQVTGLDNTTHTITVTTTTANTTYVGAAEVRQTTGLVVDNWGFGGTMTSDFLAKAYQTSYGSAVAFTAPHLLIYGNGGNEIINGQTTANQATALSSLAALFPNTDKVLRTPTPASGYSDATTKPYRDTIAAAALAAGAPLVDLYSRFGGSAGQTTLAGLGAYQADGKHLYPDGYAHMALPFANLLTR